MANQESQPQFCVGLNELVGEWHTSVAELLQLASVGKLLVGIRDFGAAHLKLPPAGVIRPNYTDDPSQFTCVGVLTLEERHIEQVASEGEAVVEVAYLHWKDGNHGVMFDTPRRVTVDDLVVPVDEVQKHQALMGEASSVETLSEKKEVTLLKIIGALGLVIAKGKGKSGNWGSEPNKDMLAKEIENTLKSLQQEQQAELNLHGLSPSNIRSYIAKGIGLLKKV